MRFFVGPIALTLILTAISGCFGAEETDPAGEHDGHAAEASGGNQTGQNNTTVNQAPVLVVSISFNGTELVPDNGSLAAPAGANLTFDASNSTDADGDNLTFSWDLGDGNTSTETTFVYAYAAAGNITVNVTADDGNNGTSTTSINLTIAQGGAAPGTILGDLNQKFTGTYTVGVQTGTSPPSNPYYCAGGTSGVSANKANSFKVPLTQDGAKVGVAALKISLTGGQTTIDQALRITAPDGKVTDVDSGDTGPNGGEAYEVEPDEPLPAGDYTISVYACIAVNGSWTLDVTATLVAI